ncbi:hypothetical protein PUN28_014647 [Cardiocondyla obscurior]|uniref:Uncharacterized protein n=1 Tax=Cardiocondyla obscurior TaxID=286306 RepID=A0AAW2EZ21_9HYME
MCYIDWRLHNNLKPVLKGSYSMDLLDAACFYLIKRLGRAIPQGVKRDYRINQLGIDGECPENYILSVLLCFPKEP